MLVVLLPIFGADTKISFSDNFRAPLCANKSNKSNNIAFGKRLFSSFSSSSRQFSELDAGIYISVFSYNFLFVYH